jgi:large subunit ribosomal protein L6
MSRTGKLPIKIPSDVKVEFFDNFVSVSNSKEKHDIPLPAGIVPELEDGFLYLTLSDITRQNQGLFGLTRSLISNSVVGISKGFTYTLEIQGVGYRAQLDGNKLVLIVGFSHNVVFPPPPGVTFAVEGNTTINIKGSRKDVVGEIAAKIRATRPPEPYKGKGIRYKGEVVRRKVGKGGKK